MFPLITSHEFYFSLIRFAWRCDFRSRKWKNANFAITHGILPRVEYFFPYEGNNRAYHALKKRCYKGIMTRIKNNYQHDYCLKVSGIWRSVIFNVFVNHKWDHRCGSRIKVCRCDPQITFSWVDVPHSAFAPWIISLFIRENNATPFCYITGKSVIINVYTI